MPAPSLPKLPAGGDFEALLAEQGEVVEFMTTEVVPRMASSLGVQPFDPATGQGFGCYDCYAAE